MDTQRRLHLAFHLTGRMLADDLDTADRLALRPALLARYRDLSALRYDFPIVVGRRRRGEPDVQSLSGLMDAALRVVAEAGEDATVIACARRLEHEIRTMVVGGDGGPFAVVWDLAAVRVVAGGDTHARADCDRLRAAVAPDGDIVDCDAAMPAALVRDLWALEHDAKARRFHERLSRLQHQLSDILRAGVAGSAAGRTAEALRTSFGATHDDVFDFNAMAVVIGQRAHAESPDDGRTRRIQRLIDVLGSQRFYGAKADGFVFDTCQSALAAFRERAPQMATVARALAAAELEVRGDYRDSHDLFFGEDLADDEALEAEDLAAFPDYLVTLNDATLSPVEQVMLIDMLAARLPVKILLQTDDLLDQSALPGGQAIGSARSRQLVHLAIGLNDVYVLQASGSHLFDCHHRIEAGLRFPGPALFNVFSGATGVNELPPYLVAAAAMESRAFPALAFDPSAGPDWASRFSLDGNSHVALDWPVHPFSYQDESHQEITEEVAFTLADFIACDPRYGRHFASVPRRTWKDHLVPVAHVLTTAVRSDTVPSLLMVDSANRLHKVVVADPIVREARRGLERWHSLQELAGLHNSHVARHVAREASVAAEAQSDPARPDARPTTPAPPAAADAAAAPAPAPASDDPYIETPRCTTCNECTGVNSVMFAYNGDKQAFIANPGAGTFAQLVEAAESCQVSIIHPGKPRNLDEPGLTELLARAAPFL